MGACQSGRVIPSEIREYRPADESSWLRCRALSFLYTSYFDDVLITKPTYDVPSIELVASNAGQVVGVLDVAISGEAATIETIAVHPDASRSGSGAALLEEAIRRLPPEVATLDAWTREDTPANAWYQKQGFAEAFRYLHVYAKEDKEVATAVTATRPGLTPVAGFFHAKIAEEEQLRRDFARVHICRQYLMQLPRP